MSISKRGGMSQQLVRWISVMDRLPRDRETVLVYYPGYTREVYPAMFWSVPGSERSELWWVADYPNVPHSKGCITHWMPLPKFPKGLTDASSCELDLVKIIDMDGYVTGEKGKVTYQALTDDEFDNLMTMHSDYSYINRAFEVKIIGKVQIPSINIDETT